MRECSNTDQHTWAKSASEVATSPFSETSFALLFDEDIMFVT